MFLEEACKPPHPPKHLGTCMIMAMAALLTKAMVDMLEA